MEGVLISVLVALCRIYFVADLTPNALEALALSLAIGRPTSRGASEPAQGIQSLSLKFQTEIARTRSDCLRNAKRIIFYTGYAIPCDPTSLTTHTTLHGFIL